MENYIGLLSKDLIRSVKTAANAFGVFLHFRFPCILVGVFLRVGANHVHKRHERRK